MDWAIVGTLVRKGIPMGGDILVLSLSGVLMITLVNRFGADTTAAFGASIQLWNYVGMPALAVGVVIGGAMTFGQHDTATGRKFLARVQQEVAARAFPMLAQRTTVDYASLGGDAGYIGAAGLARRAHLQKR